MSSQSNSPSGQNSGFGNYWARIIIIAGLAGCLFGLVAGGVGGWIMAQRSPWDLSMESGEFWQRYEATERAKIESVVSGEVKSPQIHLPEIEYDFGVLEKNDANAIGEHDFVIENIGTETLKMVEKDKTCFCTSFSILRKSVPPGEKTTVKVKWDGHRGGGDFKQSVIIGTNDPRAPEIFFNVKGLYTSPVICNPNQLAFTGISNGKEHSRDFHILGFGKKPDGSPFPLEITESTVSDGVHFRVTVEPGTLDEMTPGEKEHKILGQATSLFRGRVTVLPGLSQGAFQEVATFRTNLPELPLLELMVEGQVTGSVTISGTKYDKHGTGQLLIGSVSSRLTTTEKLRLDILDGALVADAETVRVLRRRPEWLGVEFSYPDESLQRGMPVKMIPVTVTIPAGAPQGKFSGPGLAETGEILFGIGSGESPQEVILPVSFAVGP